MVGVGVFFAHELDQCLVGRAFLVDGILFTFQQVFQTHVIVVSVLGEKGFQIGSFSHFDSEMLVFSIKPFTEYGSVLAGVAFNHYMSETIFESEVESLEVELGSEGGLKVSPLDIRFITFDD